MSEHRIFRANKDLTYVYVDDVLVGQARRGLDRKWHPEMPHRNHMAEAIADVLRSHYALAEWRDAG